MRVIYDTFVAALLNKKLVRVRFRRRDGSLVERGCVPLDYGRARRASDTSDRFHFIDVESPRGAHVMSLHPDQIVELWAEDTSFAPRDYVTWDLTASPWSFARAPIR